MQNRRGEDQENNFKDQKEESKEKIQKKVH